MKYEVCHELVNQLIRSILGWPKDRLAYTELIIARTDALIYRGFQLIAGKPRFLSSESADGS
ncbi:hypothetical protein LYNGBM3L_73020 [Moorena producens 3L]|uniref:Uncharacterized protein n=1 Tax=Moorena producens 3L TaxID=489825 RepID=F4Y397_9CYAN|nr:hypothetical protein LYNGBM3L_73020 [Moorena producens 3L]OLT63679.1 hypothetical protein BI334_00375 [Moorena producens 3L]